MYICVTIIFLSSIHVWRMYIVKDTKVWHIRLAHFFYKRRRYVKNCINRSWTPVIRTVFLLLNILLASVMVSIHLYTRIYNSLLNPRNPDDRASDNLIWCISGQLYALSWHTLSQWQESICCMPACLPSWIIECWKPSFLLSNK